MKSITHLISITSITKITLQTLLLALISCTRTNIPDPHPGVDVYIVGSRTVEGVPPKGTAVYWKNERRTDLPASTVGYLGQISEFATNITHSGTDIYISGGGASGRSIFSGTNYLAKYWKNAVSVNLSSGNTIAYASDIAVSGQDVYVVGTETTIDLQHTLPVYWKNGQRFNLLGDSSYNGYASAIAISGTDVYIAGSTADTISSQYAAAYWKNVVPVQLSNVPASVSTAICIDGADIYIAGIESNRAVYWKNKVAVYLSDVGTPATTCSISVSGGDVYVAGAVGTSAVYWKNGNMITVGDNISLGGHSVLGADIYLIGTVNPTGQSSYPSYWINDKKISFTDPSSHASASKILAISH